MKLNRIRAVLEDKGISQTWLAKKLGRRFSTVNAYALPDDVCRPPAECHTLVSVWITGYGNSILYAVALGLDSFYSDADGTAFIKLEINHSSNPVGSEIRHGVVIG